MKKQRLSILDKHGRLVPYEYLKAATDLQEGPARTGLQSFQSVKGSFAKTGLSADQSTGTASSRQTHMM